MEKCEVFDRVESCKEIVRRNVRYLIELRAVRSLLEGNEVLIELRAVRSLLEGEVFDRVESCKERLLGKWRGIRLS